MKKKKKKKKKNVPSFTKVKLSKLLLAIFRESPSKKLNYKQLSKMLKIKELGIKIQIVDALKEMAVKGVLEEVQRGSYRLFQKTTNLILKIKNHSRNGVYAEINTDNEVFIPKEYSQFVLSGDEVEISLFPKRKNSQEAEIVNVIKRKKKEFVGIIDNSSSNFFLITDDKKIPFDIFLPKQSVKKDFINKKVLVRVNGWDNKYKNPIGKVITVIGEVDNHNSEINSILLDCGFNSIFPTKIERAANKINTTISQKEVEKRLDIRSLKTFTIDPEDAKDFDDAISVKKLNKKKWEIGVHIADVSHYVAEGGIIDKEACKRGSSVYLVDRVIPMLPEVLSNNICSLKPNIDRLAYSVFFEMDEKASLINHTISKTIINSNYRFTYESAQKIIDNNRGDFKDELVLLNQLSKILRKKRMQNGSINFEQPEVKFVLDDKKNPIDVSFKEILSTNHLIEEFMLLANKTVAIHVNSNTKISHPFIYRVHDAPDQERINSLNNIIKNFGHTIDYKNPKKLPKSLNKLLEKVKGKKEQKLIETLTIRSMAKAIYTTKNIGHYGLGFKYYSHFTSPIRRYPDLIFHRLLEKYDSKSISIKKDELEKLSKHCSEMEKIASKAERDSIKYMQVKFLKNQIGKIYDGIISGVTEWGLYVEIINNKCEGLVKINSLKDDHYIYNEKKYALIGYRKRNKYQLGQKVKIKIQKADLERKQLDFLLF